MNSSERKLSQIPKFIIVGILVFSIVQIGYHHYFQTSSVAGYQKLNQPGEARFYRAVSWGSEQLLSYLLLLDVQLHDSQKGQHVSYRQLDYKTLGHWLLTLYELNPASEYPAFMATRIYSQVSDQEKILQMINVVTKMFESNPKLHWRRMTEACLLAKHQLKDLPLALDLARKVAEIPASIELPHWGRDMKLILLDELNQLESAQLLISSMLQNGQITDPDELYFLRSRLLNIQQKMSENKQNHKEIQ